MSDDTSRFQPPTDREPAAGRTEGPLAFDLSFCATGTAEIPESERRRTIDLKVPVEITGLKCGKGGAEGGDSLARIEKTFELVNKMANQFGGVPGQPVTTTADGATTATAGVGNFMHSMMGSLAGGAQARAQSPQSRDPVRGRSARSSARRSAAGTTRAAAAGRRSSQPANALRRGAVRRSSCPPRWGSMRGWRPRFA